MTQRIQSIDALRGLVMVLMTLDHTRDFFGSTFYSATDLSQTTVEVFMTRWITHLCAPGFLLLAGISVWLQTARSDKTSVRRFLFTRGILLVLLEPTLIHLIWYFHLDLHYAVAGVIWATGWSMLLASLMLSAPRFAFALVGSAILVLQPLLSDLLPSASWINILLRTEDIVWRNEFHFYTSYPILPWFGILCIGYYCGAWFQKPSGERTKRLIAAGTAMIALFILMRVLSAFGDPQKWVIYDKPWQTVLSFINLEKYPPSLDYALVTIGIALLLFVVLDKLPARISQILAVPGSAPLFYYVAHIFILHLLAIVYAGLVFGTVGFLLHGPEIFWYEHLQGHPEGYGFQLPVVYVITAVVVAGLYPCCQWYAQFKKKRRNSVVKYF